ncbi:MAG TPA: hypothetical protein VLF62_00955 [Candidatus Saccharimonadales bacterium]|nr:hypothetical protein [Candidatus Saccharimonadales bacterium]
MEHIGDLLGKYTPAASNEITAIKKYIATEFGAESSVAIQGEAVVITVQSAALANALHLRQTAIQTAAATSKRLLFRIG